MQTLDKDELITALQQEVESLRAIIAMTPGNVYWKDLEGKYLGCNKHVSDILQLPAPAAVIGLTDDDLLSPAYAEQAQKLDNKVMATQQEQYQEEVGYDAKGLPATYLTRKTPLFDRHGQLQGILGISFDITDRKKIEQKLKIAKKKAETANLAKSRFLAMISHELRTPLTSILGFANLLEQTDLSTTKKQEFTRHIIDSGSYLLTLINSLLDYNKLETNKFDFTAFPVNLKEVTENVISMLNVTASAKQLTLKMEYAEEAPALILSNSRVLRQILINLIGNAIKFTQKGHIIVRVSCKKATATTATLEIAVEDTGSGMTLEDQHHIFKHFTQLGNVYTRNTSLTGTGLGLAIVKKLVKLLGGKIRVKSQLNKGSTFYLTSAFTTLSPQDVPWLPYADRVKILGVQQQERDNSLHTLLANTFYDVVSADEALETVLATQTTLQPYDIVVFDPAALAGCRDLLSTLYQQADFKIPLLLGLTTEATPAAAHVNAMIAVNLENPNVKQFHQDLTLAWEGWLASANQSPRQAIQHPRVLLIEDNELIQIIHKHMLEDLGCKVDVSDTANHALQQLTQPYDMLFVDIGLPDIAGFDLIKKIRQQDNHLAEVPIIVLTGYSEESERDHCLQAGANEVAIKPVSKETLDSILQRYVIR